MTRPSFAKLVLRWGSVVATTTVLTGSSTLALCYAAGVWRSRLVQEIPSAYTVPGPAPRIPWPSSGQAALAVNGIGTLGVSGDVDAAQPIASVAKVLTAYQILTEHPLSAQEPGPTITVLPNEAAQYDDQVRRDESVVPVAAGEELTERQALEALLLPSADNIALILARWDAGSVSAFLERENATATALGMTRSHYTDPSGLDPGTVSTAPDQLRLEQAAMALPAMAALVAERQAVVPVAGTVVNFNHLLGRDGVVGVKTGSTMAAGGCLMFAADVPVAGGPMERVYGVVLGAPGRASQILANALAAGDRLVQAARAVLTTATVAPAGRRVAEVRQTWSGDHPLATTGDVDVIGWPGLGFRLSVGGTATAPVLNVVGAANPADREAVALRTE